MNKIINKKKQRHKRFYDFDPNANRMFHIHLIEDYENNPRPWLWKENRQERIDYAVKMFDTTMSRIDWLHDDYIPHATCITGTEVFAEAFGSEVSKPVGSEPFALPVIYNYKDIYKIKVPKLEDSTLWWIFDFADDLKEKCGNDVVLGMPDIQTPMDIAALIWDKNDFFPSMLEEPEAVKAIAAKVSELFFAFFDEWFLRYGPEFVSHCPDYYMPSGFTYSEDEVGSVSPQIFKKFFLPELIDISDRYGNIGMHCCADARHQWSNFTKIPNLKLINLVQPHETIIESSTFFAKNSCIFPSWTGTGAPETWYSQLDKDAFVYLDFFVKDEDEAKALADKLNKITERETV